MVSSSLQHGLINETALNFNDLINATQVINIKSIELFHLKQGICILGPDNLFLLHFPNRESPLPLMSSFLGSLWESVSEEKVSQIKEGKGGKTDKQMASEMPQGFFLREEWLLTLRGLFPEERHTGQPRLQLQAITFTERHLGGSIC